jgi:hypothetical protein
LIKNFSLLVFLPRVKRKGIFKTQQQIIAVQKMGVPEEGATMSDANKTGRIAEKGWLGSFNLWIKLRGLFEI